MGFVEDELSEVKKLCEQVVPDTKLVSCVPTMVRVEIKRTDFKKIIVCMQFPENYPGSPLLVELKSKTLSEKLLLNLTNVCEKELKNYLGKAQVLHIVKFLRKFVDDNPLSCCYDEISSLRKSLTQKDEFKLKQKSSSINLKVFNEGYHLTCKIFVPEDYPRCAVEVQDATTNFTSAFNIHIFAQAKEIARRCVEPPLKKNPNAPPFEPGPSLKNTVSFLIDCIKRLPQEECRFCGKKCFPSNPEELEKNETSPNHIERVYCGHLYHQGCLLQFMKLPPFGNKTCSKCGNKIHHFKWNVSDKMAEERWAHEQARDRELQEVFLREI